MKSILTRAGMVVLTTLFVYIISCQKSNHDDTTNPPKQVEYVTASVSGRITDENDLPVSGVTVKAGIASTTTDANGNFKITGVSLDKNAGFVKAEKDGYFQAGRTILVNAGTTNPVNIQLIKKIVAGSVSGSGGGNITVPSGGSVNFTGNSFTNTANGSTYTGTVSVSAFFLNPTAGNFNNIMPGTLRGINSSNQETGLQSFGMMAVELTGSGGEKLQLTSGKTATITFPIPTALQSIAPATIPLWSFNDSSGLWKEEGTATKQGSNYIGTVTHFSFWNCDYPYQLVQFNATIKDGNGKGVFPARVVLKTTSDSVSTYGSGYTDSAGLVSGKIPSNKSFELKVYNDCNTVLYSTTVGPFTTDANLGTITIGSTGLTTVTFSGTVRNCSNSNVTDGFVDILLDSKHYVAAVNNGNFNITINRCSAATATAQITPYDKSTNQTGSTSNISVTSGNVSTGQLLACGTTAAQYLTFTLGGSNYNYVSPADSLSMSHQSNYYNVSTYRKSGNGGSVYFSFTATGTGSFPLTYINIYNGSTLYINPGPMNVNITEYGAVGSYVAGTLTGTLRDSLNAASTANLDMQFRFKRNN